MIVTPYHHLYIYDCHDAYRAYACFLNWRRPRGHKLSWRGLSRAQRIAAIDWIDRMLPLGGWAAERR